MSIGARALYHLAKRWPVPKNVKNRVKVYDENYHLNYALNNQYLLKLRQGINFDFYDKKVLEIGCGHGGISTLLAVCGSKHVVGMDINKENLKHAQSFSEREASRLGINKLPLDFVEMSAYDMKLEYNSFDIVIADNVFEHFMDPQKVLTESYKVLRSGGKLVVPIFSSIYSKYALHLKNGLKVPWTNLFFSEKTIVKALHRLAENDATIFEAYPGLINKPDNVRDVRRYGDLNDITYSKFKKMADDAGFKITSFNTIAPKGIKTWAAVIRRIPFIKKSILADVFSTGASAVLVKR